MTDMLVYNKKFKSINEIFGLDNTCHIVAGPCAVENSNELEEVAISLIKKRC